MAMTTAQSGDVTINFKEYSLEGRRGSTPPVKTGLFPVLADMRGSLAVVGGLISTWEAVFGCAIAVGSTLLCYFFDFRSDSSAVSTILGIVIVFPITALIGFAFTRREAALAAFATLLGNLEALLGAVVSWKKEVGGGWVRVTEGDAAERALAACGRVAEKASRYCATPRGHRTRYVLSSYGSERETLNHLLHLRKSEVGSAIQACRRLVQQLKVEGLPGGEAHRLDQYVSIIACHFHQVAMLKEYRTPVGARALARIWVVWHGIFAGPWYASLSAGGGTGPALPVIYALALQLAFNALLQVAFGLEDPYARAGGRGVHDSVRVRNVADQSRTEMARTAREATLPWDADLGIVSEEC